MKTFILSMMLMGSVHASGIETIIVCPVGEPCKQITIIRN